MGAKSSKTADVSTENKMPMMEEPKDVKSKKKDNRSKKSKDLLLDELHEHEDAINCMALSDDGSLLVTGGEDCVAKMWCTKTPSCECLGALEGHTSYITCVVIMDTYVLTGSADHTARKWDMANCECLFVFEGHTSRICRIICTNEFVFTSSYDKTARIWIFEADGLIGGNEDKACLRVLKGHAKGVYPLVFIPADGEPSKVQVDGNQMNINPGDLLITGSADCTARSWSVDTGGCLKIFEGHTMPIMCMATDNEGKILFTAGGDSTIFSWDVKTATRLLEFNGHSSAVLGMQVVNRLMYTASSDQTVRAWVTEFGDSTRIYTNDDQNVTSFRYSDGYVFTGSGDGTVRVFDAKSATLRQEYRGHNGTVTAVLVVDRKLYTACIDGKLRVWKADHLIAEVPSPPNSKSECLEKNNKKLKELEDDLDDYIKEDPVKSIQQHAEKAKTGALGETKKLDTPLAELPGTAAVSEAGHSVKDAAMNQVNASKQTAVDQAKKLANTPIADQAKKLADAPIVDQAKKLADQAGGSATNVGQAITSAAGNAIPA